MSCSQSRSSRRFILHRLKRKMSVAHEKTVVAANTNTTTNTTTNTNSITETLSEYTAENGLLDGTYHPTKGSKIRMPWRATL
jgi:hypothetical protein